MVRPRPRGQRMKMTLASKSIVFILCPRGRGRTIVTLFEAPSSGLP
jgi:hypothetical protein